ncbi:sphingomyelin synthase family protein [Patescibacteria group bacterium]|nr:sphingomyelin synthase family protein [Patescibacteria group bacterium]MBU1448728.1 sphingomyelin synthase family protein [Patescibacteria group bacterium]MBU2613010.1 sphingomyelin synthase family protein [Patescibacteria group bacterium]
MKRILRRHSDLWHRKDFLLSVLWGILLLGAGMVANYAAGVYATAKASNAVTDIVLDFLPVMNVDLLFIEGSVVFILFLVIILFLQPKHLPFVLKSIGLFVLIRSFSVSLTHIGPFPEQIDFSPGSITKLIIFPGDLFFSGHTGLPFLLSLIFWDDRRLRYTFLGFSVLFAATVLLGHLHYSIDIFAAYFVTYTIFHIATLAFRKDAERSRMEHL